MIGTRDFAVDFVDIVLAGRRLGRDVSAEAGRNDRIGGEAARSGGGARSRRRLRAARLAGRPADRDSSRYNHTRCWMLLSCSVKPIQSSIAGVIEPVAAEQVQRNARCRAVRDRPDRLRDPVRADVAGEALLRLVDAEQGVDVPVPFVAADVEPAVECRRRRIGFDLLVEVALPGLDQTAGDERVIGRLARCGVPFGLTPDWSVTPNGLYGLVASIDKVSNRLPAPLPASGPMNSGS